ncbi:hypothetical protein AAG570_007818 [Ranatra chinensis]|uniref:AB hydrolase-1 domain-containing protein n=1 Tax=Ranatra chinensis TaxID=642074 RepID=A0ABD0YII5_9HEMI
MQVDLIETYGLKGEKHEIKTSGGYIIQVFRIPNKDPKAPTVLLQHGLMVTSDIFVFTNMSLAIALAKDGNDVWLGNARGNVYSRANDKLSVDDQKFWDFSWHEMGTQDLPDIIDYIVKTADKHKIDYVGHSMGSTMFFVMASERPEYNDKIDNMVALAPVVYCNKYQFIITKGSSMHKMAEDTFRKFEENKKWEAFPRNDIQSNGHQLGCDDLPEMAVAFCKSGLEVSASAILNLALVPGISLLTTIYFSHFITGKIGKFDYGSAMENQKMYKSDSPPDYNMKNVKIPVHIFYAESDQLIDSTDIDSLAKDLPNVALKMQMPNENFNHIDFVYRSSDEIAQDYETLLAKIKEIVKK